MNMLDCRPLLETQLPRNALDSHLNRPSMEYYHNLDVYLVLVKPCS